MKAFHFEMYQTLAKMIEKKIITLENKIKYPLTTFNNEQTYIQTQYGLYDTQDDDDIYTWSNILDDICINTNCKVNSKFRPYGDSMPWE